MEDYHPARILQRELAKHSMDLQHGLAGVATANYTVNIEARAEWLLELVQRTAK